MDNSELFNLEHNEKLRVQYENADGVLARWKTYSLTKDGTKHFENAISASIIFDELNRLLDIGASNASFLRKIQHLGNGSMRAVGVDKFVNQFKPLSPMPGPIEGLITPTDIHMINGDADALPISGSSFEIVTALYMLYHLKGGALGSALEETKRVLTEDGLFIVTTSGDQNKYGTRELEESIARQLGVDPPPHMNYGFTTENAEIILPEYFKYGAVFKTQSEIMLSRNNPAKDFKARLIYANALSSLAHMYLPPLDMDSTAFMEVVESTVLDAQRNEDFRDEAFRAMFVCSNEPLSDSRYLDLSMLDEPNDTWQRN